MFDDPRFDRFEPEGLPRDRDALLVDVHYAGDYEAGYIRLFDGGPVPEIGYVSYVSVRAVHEATVDLSWYPNIFDRFHEVAISLPRDQLYHCVGCWAWDWDPTLFVASRWLRSLYAKNFSVFGMLDAIGVRDAIRAERLSREMLLNLRGAVDTISARYPDIAFISFADSLLMKSNWTVSSQNAGSNHTYSPERFIALASDLREAFLDELGLDSYMVLTQGYNEYYADDLLHISESRNHICLNSIGVPFAQLVSIEKAARNALRTGRHPAAHLYLDETFYRSLRFRLEFDKNQKPRATYEDLMRGRASDYFYAEIDEIMDGLDPEVMR